MELVRKGWRRGDGVRQKQARRRNISSLHQQRDKRKEHHILVPLTEVQIPPLVIYMVLPGTTLGNCVTNVCSLCGEYITASHGTWQEACKNNTTASYTQVHGFQGTEGKTFINSPSVFTLGPQIATKVRKVHAFTLNFQEQAFLDSSQSCFLMGFICMLTWT